MSDALANAKLWEQGCHTDAVRNEFVIPQIAKIIEAIGPDTILDVGCGTGYVARQIDLKVTCRPHWHLIDLSPERLSLAETLKPRNMRQSLRCCDLADLTTDQTYGLVLALFTLLEIERPFEAAAKLAALTSPGGTLVVVIPDCLGDVLAGRPSGALPPEFFTTGRIQIDKIDKFTNEPYPFVAMRAEFVIEAVLASGLALIGLRRFGPPETGVYLFHFARLPRPSHVTI